MIKENCIKLLGLGLSQCENAFGNVQIDINSAEKNCNADSFSCMEEDFRPNSVEIKNLMLRDKYHIQSFCASELSHCIRTRNYAYKHTLYIIGAAEYLLKVLELAIDVNNDLKNIINKSKSIKRNTKFSNKDKEHMTVFSSVDLFLAILLKIRTRISDLEAANEYKNRITRTYSNLDTTVKTMLQTTWIPDDMAGSFNDLYEKIPLNKFSDGKKNGLSENAMSASFKDFSLRLYSSAIKPFLSELMEEFSPYITPDTYLNNAKKKAIFVVPISIYKKFNFTRSGLTRKEIVFIESHDDMEKTIKNLSEFYTELSDAMNCMYNKALEQKEELFSKKDEYEVEWIIDEFLKRYASTKEGNIKSIKLMLKNDFFREKFTVLLYELRPDLIVDMLTAGGNPWETYDGYTTEQYDLDFETVTYLYHLLKLAFADTVFPSQNAQLARFLHLLSCNESPERSFCRLFRNLKAGKITWSKTETGYRFKEALER